MGGPYPQPPATGGHEPGRIRTDVDLHRPRITGPSTLAWVSFNVSADAYLRFMGKYSEPLAVQFAELAGIGAGLRVLDVGCGPGALTAELVRRTGPGAVRAVEPSAPFVAAARERLPGVDIQQAAAEQLPFADQTFNAALAQLVVHFMKDPLQGLREMGRVTRPDGIVGAWYGTMRAAVARC